jgi:hypothetical protein
MVEEFVKRFSSEIKEDYRRSSFNVALFIYYLCLLKNLQLEKKLCFIFSGNQFRGLLNFYNFENQTLDSSLQKCVKMLIKYYSRYLLEN